MSDIFGGVFDWVASSYNDMGTYFDDLGTKITGGSGSIIGTAAEEAADDDSFLPSFGDVIGAGAKAITSSQAGQRQRSGPSRSTDAIARDNFTKVGGEFGTKSTAKAITVSPEQFYNDWSFRLKRYAGIAADTGTKLK